MPRIQEQVAKALGLLSGRKLSLARRILDVRTFHFGKIERIGKGALAGEFALHLNCPWRIEQGDRIITGRHDHFARADENDDVAWEVGTPWGTYQEQVLVQLLGQYDAETESCVNVSDQLIVQDIDADSYGGASIRMTGGYRLVIFPAGTRNEHWRLLPPGDADHFVVEGIEAYWG